MAKYRVTFQGPPGELREIGLGHNGHGPVVAKLHGGEPVELELTPEQFASLSRKPAYVVEQVGAKRAKGGGE